jgi:uncharacterized protein (DUF1501 family)
VDSITRRRFLVASGVTAGLALATGAITVTFKELINAGQSGDHPLPPPPDTTILVLVTLYGGNDGLNTVVPASNPAYRKNRPDLAYGEDEVLPLGEGLGLNPAMTGFKAMWDDKRLAIVRGVSYPKPDHSHFRSMAIWQTASPATASRTGWLGRWLDVTGGNPLHAISVGYTLPPMLAGDTVAGAALPLGGVQIPRQLRIPLVSLCAQDHADSPDQARAARSIADLRSVVQTFGPALDGDGGGDNQLDAQLDVVAQCIIAGAPTRAYCVSLDGFDTHSAEKGTQSQLLGQLDSAVTKFLKSVGVVPAGKQVVVAIYSEFGRRVAANANQGTDHGTSGPVFIAGPRVTGGFFGDQPSLTKLDDGDLHTTVDFRDVYGTLLQTVLRTDPRQIITDYKPKMLGFL